MFRGRLPFQLLPLLQLQLVVNQRHLCDYGHHCDDISYLLSHVLSTIIMEMWCWSMTISDFVTLILTKVWRTVQLLLVAIFCSRDFHGTIWIFRDTFPDNLHKIAFITWWMTKVFVSCSQDTCWGRNVISVCWSGREGERERCAKVGTRELEQGAEMFVRRGSWEVCDGKEICHAYCVWLGVW